MAYECQNFVDGQILTAACLNRIEQALADICNKDTPFYDLKEMGCQAIPAGVAGKFSSISFSNKDFEGYDDIVASFGHYNRIKFLIPFEDYGDVVVDTALNISNITHPNTGESIPIYSYTGSMSRTVNVGWGDNVVFTDVTVYVAPNLLEHITIAFRPTLPDLFSQNLQLSEAAKAQARANIGASTSSTTDAVPEFDLTNMGLPVITLSGAPVSCQANTTLICEAMSRGAIKIRAAVNYNNTVIHANAFATPCCAEEAGSYQLSVTFNLGALVTLVFVIDNNSISAIPKVFNSAEGVGF